MLCLLQKASDRTIPGEGSVVFEVSPNRGQQDPIEQFLPKHHSPIEESRSGMSRYFTPLKSGTPNEVDTSNEKRPVDCNTIVLLAEFAKSNSSPSAKISTSITIPRK